MTVTVAQLDKEKDYCPVEQRKPPTRIFWAGSVVIAIGCVVAAIGYGVQLQAHSKQILNLMEEVSNNKKTIEVLKNQCLTSRNEVHKSDKLHESNGYSRSLPSSTLTRRERSVEDAFMGTHMVGTAGRFQLHCPAHPEHCLFLQVPRPGKYFTWSLEGELALHPMRVDVTTNRNGTFINIRKAGYYFVYAQVTYYSHGLKETGHEVVQRVGNRDKVLMTYINTQRMGTALHGNGLHMRTLDSGYDGGVFYLYPDDKVAVRPVNAQMSRQRFYMQPAKSFFGLYYVHD